MEEETGGDREAQEEASDPIDQLIAGLVRLEQPPAPAKSDLNGRIDYLLAENGKRSRAIVQRVLRRHATQARSDGYE